MSDRADSPQFSPAESGAELPGSQHVPVLAAEVLEGLNPQPSHIVADATFGGGGHARLLAERIGSTGHLIGIDRDPQAVARARLLTWPCRCDVSLGCYDELGEVLDELGLGDTRLDAALLDLGLSSDQLADAERGFSFRVDGPLDLRFNPALGQPAWQLVEQLPERELARVLFEYGEERLSRRIARRIVDERRRGPLRTTARLAELVRGCYPPQRARGRRDRPAIDPATRTFQALRIAVNQELEHLRRALERFPNWLRPGGRLAVISFHSLEDRLVKQAFRSDRRWDVLTRKPIVATADELRANPRARSAKLRVAARSPDDR